MKTYVIALFFFLVLFFSCREKKQTKPNILFLFADDLTYAGIRSMGNNEVKTPNLDNLAKSGLTFTHTFNMGAWHGAVCVASRTMLHTGKFLWKAKQAEEELFPQMEKEGQFWSQIMHANGYQTFMSGKWHINYEPQLLFEETRHIRAGMPATVGKAYNRPLSMEDMEWLPWDTGNGGYWEGGKHWSEIAADDAIEFMEKMKGGQSPFFMYVAFNAPHDPRQSPKEFVDAYSPDSVSIPKSFLEEYPFKDGIGCGPDLRDEKLAPFPRTPYSIKVHRQEYYAIISHLDHQIGRILEYLKKSGLNENTVVVFSADNGLAIGSHGLMGKQNMYDHSMRVPLIISGPGFPENQRCSIPVYLQDIMPTTLELAGIQIPQFVEFKSLIPAFMYQKHPYPEIYGAYMNLQRMVRTDEYKLILYPQIRTVRLYNIASDPDELIDLSRDKNFDPVIEGLVQQLKLQQQFTCDTLNLSGFFPDLF